MHSSWLKLNSGKIEMVLVARGKYLEELASLHLHIIKGICPHIVESVYSFRVFLDSSLLLDAHIDTQPTMPISVAGQKIVAHSILAMVIHALLTSGLECGKSIVSKNEIASLEKAPASKLCSNSST